MRVLAAACVRIDKRKRRPLPCPTGSRGRPVAWPTSPFRGDQGPGEETVQCQIPPLQVPLTRRLWRLDQALYWATKPRWTGGMLPLVEPGLQRANLGGVVGAGNRKCWRYSVACTVDTRRAPMWVAQNIFVRGITAGRAGVTAFAAEAVKLVQAEGYGSIKATEAGPLPAGRNPRPSGRGECQIHLHSVYG